MKRALTVLFLAIVLITSSFAMAGASDGPQLTVTATALNVRQGPGTTYSVIDLLHTGDRVLATGQNSAAGWYQITLSDGRTGWVSGLYVQEDEPPPPHHKRALNWVRRRFARRESASKEG